MMPAFEKFAYTDGRCYNLKQADLQRMNATLPDPPATLQNREIEQLADFLFAKVVGKGPMDRAKCIEFGAPTSPPAPSSRNRPSPGARGSICLRRRVSGVY